MGRKSVTLYPTSRRLLADMGERIQLARLRRKLSVELVAERAGVSRSSVWAVERGSPSVSMGIYTQVLLAIGIDGDLAQIAADDELGRTLQDLDLPTRRRAPKRGPDG
ncbi:MAG: XRE family transcriptional regulator [Spirochaetaceae bacterium]|nr:MAG: XRE family transcriptional regulator [Spirochaetaceae bacterium]